MNFRTGIKIGAVSNFISFALNFLSVIMVSRLLTPSEIGIFSVSVSILGVSHVLREFGVGQYLVQAKKIGDNEFRAAFSVTLWSSWVIAALIFFGRHPFSNFYSHDGIADVLALIAFNFLIMPFGTPLLALLQRELEFGKLAVVRITNSAASTIVTIAAAWAGESYLSMAWGAIAGHIANVILLNMMRPGRILMLPTLRGLGEVFRFGSLATVSSLLAQIGTAMPDLILGRTLGFSAVAFYSRADGLRNMALGQLLRLVRGVYFPSFAKGLRDGEDPAALYTKVMLYLVAVTAPGMALAAVIADPLIIFLFGPQWERASLLAAMICIMAVISAPYTMANSSLVASGNLRPLIVSQSITESLRALALLSSIWVPLEQAVAALVAATAFSNFLYQRALSKAFGLGFLEFMKKLMPSLALIPFTILGPALVVVLAPGEERTASQHFGIIATSGLLGTAGWLLGVHLLSHPIKNEITLMANGASAKIRSLIKRS